MKQLKIKCYLIALQNERLIGRSDASVGVDFRKSKLHFARRTRSPKMRPLPCCAGGSRVPQWANAHTQWPSLRMSSLHPIAGLYCSWKCRSALVAMTSYQGTTVLRYIFLKTKWNFTQFNWDREMSWEISLLFPIKGKLIWLTVMLFSELFISYAFKQFLKQEAI